MIFACSILLNQISISYARTYNINVINIECLGRCSRQDTVDSGVRPGDHREVPNAVGVADVGLEPDGRGHETPHRARHLQQLGPHADKKAEKAAMIFDLIRGCKNVLYLSLVNHPSCANLLEQFAYQ